MLHVMTAAAATAARIRSPSGRVPADRPRSPDGSTAYSIVLFHRTLARRGAILDATLMAATGRRILT